MQNSTNADLKNEGAHTGENALKNTIPTDEKNTSESQKSKPTNENLMVDSTQDYSLFSKEECIKTLQELLSKEPVEAVNKSVKTLKTAFYKLYRSEANAALKHYKKLHGFSMGFEHKDEMEVEFKTLLQNYKAKRAAYNQNLEEEKQLNLVKKQQIIEAIKALINSEEITQKTFNEFKTLQTQWFEIGMVPQTHVRILWDTYNYHVEKFYDFLKINRELRDLDYQKNLEAKQELCKKAEELVRQPKVIEAFHQLQELHQQWRETGPVHPKHREEIWGIFKEFTYQINKKHQDCFSKIKEQQKENLKEKTLICEKIEEVVNSHEAYDRIKKWNAVTKIVLRLQEKWRTIGFVPKNENAKIFKRFRTACDTFFDKKRSFIDKIHSSLENNFAKKKALVEKVKEITNTKDLEKVKQEVITLQQEWKKIGPVPFKFADKIWEEFKKPCNTFFEKLHNKELNLTQEEQNANLELKKKLLGEMKEETFEKTPTKEAFKKISDFQKRFYEIGFVPMASKEELSKEFTQELNRLIERAKIDENSKNILLYKEKVRNLKQRNAKHKLSKEISSLRNKISTLKSDINLWTNNLSFINCSSKNGQKIVQEYRQKIDTNQERINLFKEKLNIINRGS